MNRLLTTAVVAASLLCGVLYAPPAKDNSPPVSTILTVDGVACGPVAKWDGGDMRAKAADETSGGKHISSSECSPVSFEIPFPAAKPLMDLITDLCANGQKQVTLVLADVSSGTPVEVHALEVQYAILTEMRFPALPLKDSLRVTLVFQGDQSRTAAAPPLGPDALQKKVVPASFRLEVPGVEIGAVSGVEAFTIKRKVEFESVGIMKDYKAHSVQSEFPNILVTLPRVRSDGLAAWRDASFRASPNSSGTEKNGTLSLLDGSARTIVTFQFTNLGIVRLSGVPNAAPAPRMMQADFYCEGITLTVPEAKTEAMPRVRR